VVTNGRTRLLTSIRDYSLLFPLDLVSVLGFVFGSTAFEAEAEAEVSADLDSEELLSDLVSDLDSAPFESDLLSDELFESEAADFLYESLR